jgi:hypothetical protein
LPLNLDAVVIHLIVSTILIAPSLWIAGRLLVGKQKAKFTDAILTVVLGTIVGMVIGALFSGFIALVVVLVLWLALVKHFFDCGWLMALIISIVAIIVFVVIAFILALLGFTLIEWVLPALPIV